MCFKDPCVSVLVLGEHTSECWNLLDVRLGRRPCENMLWKGIIGPLSLSISLFCFLAPCTPAMFHHSTKPIGPDMHGANFSWTGTVS